MFYDRIKKDRDVKYSKILQENEDLRAERKQAEKERDFAIETMHMVASDALKTIKELEAALEKKANDKTIDDLLSLHRKNKDDILN